ncbi:MAG TPA: hypothetical protein VK004_01110 [Ignavibacteria bacterium]|nr:hypothetical protein [Ignavibacteria bacterium]
MKNRLIISFFVHFLLGILFVFPVYSAQTFSHNKDVIEAVGFYGEDDQDGDGVRKSKKKISPKKETYKKFFSLLKTTQNYFYITKFICEADICSEFSLKYSQQIVDISFLKSLRSVVMRC